ncbi:hypothetical protein PLICRDRAFT_91909 [Plicaturopsis crispa FD-325 SS-3]|nr:hypothetical protein PLICRDRAFT_91909 [Plicaturopsis crispa FD-325 SS-3]
MLLTRTRGDKTASSHHREITRVSVKCPSKVMRRARDSAFVSKRNSNNCAASTALFVPRVNEEYCDREGRIG